MTPTPSQIAELKAAGYTVEHWQWGSRQWILGMPRDHGRYRRFGQENRAWSAAWAHYTRSQYEESHP